MTTKRSRPAVAHVAMRSDDEGMTLEQVGRVLGVTRERVRQIENEALRKAAAVLAAKGYRFADLIDRPTQDGRGRQANL